MKGPLKISSVIFLFMVLLLFKRYEQMVFMNKQMIKVRFLHQLFVCI
jgi:hypothetical protein